MILVTGATGLLGSRIIEELLNNNESVRILARNAKKLRFAERFKDKVEIYEGDILDIFAVEAALKGIEKVIHCAAVVSFSPKMREALMQVNVQGTAQLVDLCLEHNIQKLVHISSIAALGRAGEGKIITEKTEWQDSNQNSFYSISKYQSEMEVWRGQAEGLNTVIVNPGLILGPGDWSTDSSSLFHVGYKKIPYYAKGMNGFVDVDDVAKITVQLAQSEINGERFLAVGQNVSYKELFGTMSKVYGHKPAQKPLPDWLGQIGWRLEKIRSFFQGKEPVVTKETIRTTLHEYRYSSEKVQKALNYTFKPMKKTLEENAKRYLTATKNA